MELAYDGRDEAIAVEPWQIATTVGGMLGVGGAVGTLVQYALKQRGDAPKLAADQTKAETERDVAEAALHATLRAELRDENRALRVRAVEAEEIAARRVHAAEERYSELKSEMGMLAASVENLIQGAQRATRERDETREHLTRIDLERAQLIALNDGLRAQNVELKSANDALRRHNTTLIAANGELAQRTEHLESDLKKLGESVAQARRRPTGG